MGGEGIDTLMGVAALVFAGVLVVWAVVALVVRRRGRSELVMRRHARRVIRERGLGRFRPTVEVSPGHAVVRWEEPSPEGDVSRALLVVSHHVADH